MVDRPAVSLRLSWMQIAAAILIVLFAFALRVTVIFERAAHNAAFDPLPPGNDQQTYYELATRLHAGTWPDAPFHYQPGIVYYLAMIQSLLPDAAAPGALGLARLYIALTGALGCGCLIGAGWLLRGRVWDGFAVGLLYAVYPVSVFAATDFLIEGLATFYVCLLLFLALWQTHHLNPIRSILLGLLIGLVCITRSNLALLIAPVLALTVTFASTWKQRSLHAPLIVAGTVAAILPITLTNLRFSTFQLITDSKADELYMANNRDADGFRNPYLAYELELATTKDYSGALLKDFQYDPVRFIELQIHKAGIYWNFIEGGNNLSYATSGSGASALLRAIPLNFRILSAVGLLGLVPIFAASRRKGWFLVALNLLIFIGIMPIWIEGRLRWTAIPPLALSGGVMAVALVEILVRREWQRFRLWAPAATAIAIFLFAANLAYEYLPRDRHYADLPADLHPVQVVVDDHIELVGWRTPDAWGGGSERGWLHPGDLYLVELLWRVKPGTQHDYHHAVKLLIGDQEIAAVAGAVGRIAFPFDLTSAWRSDVIYAETVGFQIPADAPVMHSGSVLVSIYRTEGEERAVTVIPLDGGDVTLHALAAYPPDAPAPTTDPLYTFSDQIALHGIDLPVTVQRGKTFTLSLDWSALREIDQDYVRFIHLMDSENQQVGGKDSPPLEGTLVTSTWQPGILIAEQVTLTAPVDPGVYQIYLGWYDASLVRLTVDAPDNRVLLGELMVE